MTLCVGFLGYGSWVTRTRMHYKGSSRDGLPGCTGDGTARPERARRDDARECGSRLSCSKTETDWRAALDEIDVLYNFSPNAVHPEPSIAALRQDVHVMCEKPLAHRLEVAEERTEAARESAAVTATAFNY